MKRIFGITVLTLGSCLIASSALAQGLSEPYSPGVTNDAVSYWLPRTCLSITVNTRRTTFTPGEFSRYAERYLRLNNVKDKSEESWEITGITVTEYGAPDKEHLYTLVFPNKGARPYIELTDDGIISAVNLHTDIGKQEDEVPTRIIEKSTTPFSDAQLYMTEEIIMAGSIAKMAELTAKEIYSIRESRNLITRGQAEYMPTDGESAKIFLEHLDKQEVALLTLFSGNTEVYEESFTININPETSVSKLMAFRFSAKLGVLPVNNLAGEPVWIDIEDKEMMSGGQNQSQKGNMTSTLEKGRNKDGFLFCRIPGRAIVRIYNNRQSFVTKEIPFAQFGSVEVVSRNIMGKNADTKITFNTTTGGITGINE